MIATPFFQIDAFTGSVFSGNPAGVCLLERWLDDGVLQAIAAENNLSETAFLVKRGALYELRWFTPEVEVNLCGLLGKEAFATKAVSATGEGVHTTARRQLLLLDGGALLVDTPGMRELGLLGADDGLDLSFPEIRELSAQCRFADCTHTAEPGCAVAAALERGELPRESYHSYLKLRKESEHFDRSYVEKRKRDKAFGKMVRSAMKHLKK